MLAEISMAALLILHQTMPSIPKTLTIQLVRMAIPEQLDGHYVVILYGSEPVLTAVI